MTSRKRIFLVDHMCVLPFGHNLNALVLFKAAMEPFYDEAICLATKYLPEYAEQSSLVERVLYFPYSGIVPTPPAKNVSGGGSSTKAKGRGGSSLGMRARFLLNAIAERYLGIEYTKRMTLQNWRSLFRKYRFTKDDVIFFPSAEHYGVVSLLEYLEEFEKDERPSVGIRLIGVAEGTTYSGGLGRAKFFEVIRKAILGGTSISLSAETITYADFTSRILGHHVEYLPYPFALPLQPIKWATVKNICSPGQGRADKGFLRLYSIIRGIIKRKGEGSFTFEVQNMRESDKYFRARYSDMLRSVDMLDLHPARMKQADIDDMYSRADIIVMPYDSDTYALRGSAVYQEGMAIGRMFVCSSGLGMSDLVKRYGNGFLADSDREFSDKVIQLSELDGEEVRAIVANARSLYEKDFDAGLNVTVSRLTK
ncbi:glycosyltransferase [Rhizobium sp. UGM030330-04]|uniref:glycosyltransferase n=1 Tax=Rhizobium sp. UGM030330-04 TaxID=1378077 RepID=UPI000D83A7CC|nr:glycosyltransferase [Rhizobium sp. UGM030330-04]PYG57396.1 glycosyl transferase family 1 [Rhizobium sp. UGM030330-04]